MRALIRLALFCCVSIGSVSSAQSLSRDPCNAMPEGAQHYFGFNQFDSELRQALKAHDATALAFLVQFPLRINSSKGTILLGDAEALRTRFDDIFSQGTIQSILETDADAASLGCNAEGIGYGRGDIWVNATERGYSIWTVNPESARPGNERKAGLVDYVCQTDSYRIVIDEPSGELRYRSWNRPHAITASPDLQVTQGKQTFGGTNVCAVPVYTFHNGTTTYRIGAGLGCFEKEPPKGATGDLEVATHGKIVLQTWCF